MSETKQEFERDEAALAAARGRVYAFFDALDIPYKAFDHRPIFSAADEARENIEIDAFICKNLFLRNKDKSRYYLYTLPLHKRADLPALQKAIGETRLSFGTEDALWDHLRIRPGSVSLLNIIDAPKPLLLKFLLDAKLLSVPRIGVHPNDNAATIVFAPDRLAEIFAHFGADFAFVE